MLKFKGAANSIMTTSILYDRVLSPLYDRLALALFPDAVHPNAITLGGGAFCGLALVALRGGHYGAASACWTTYTAMDNMDGKHARRTGQCSALGSFLDHFVDGTVGMLVGHETLIGPVFGHGGVHGGYYWRAYHASALMWLAPHVVALFSGRLDLGSRWFGADEMFLLTSLTLALAAAHGAPLLNPAGSGDGGGISSSSFGGGPALYESFVTLLTVLGPAYVCAAVPYHVRQQRQRRQEEEAKGKKTVAGARGPAMVVACGLAAAYAAFWLAGVSGAVDAESLMRYGWVPLMLALVVGSSLS